MLVFQTYLVYIALLDAWIFDFKAQNGTHCKGPPLRIWPIIACSFSEQITPFLLLSPDAWTLQHSSGQAWEHPPPHQRNTMP
jgi:hypothetical protein